MEQVRVSATFAAFGCHRKTHTQPVIYAFLGHVDSNAYDKNSWTVNLKVKELIIIYRKKTVINITQKISQPKNNAIKIGTLHF